jgi:hypothetical protein
MRSDGEVFRWRVHTPRSRRVTWVVMGLIGVGAVIVSGDRDGSWIGFLPIVGAFWLSMLSRKWTVVIVRPRPKRAIDKRDFARLAAAQFATMIIAISGLAWLVLKAKQGLSPPLALCGAAVGVALVLVNRLFLRAYDRLFERIAKHEEAYGF